MRVIKFRGLTESGGWVYGNLFVPDKLVKGVYICPTTNYANFAPTFEDGDDLETVMQDGCSLGRFIEVNPNTVGQFTGLLDINGVEIYEGDIFESIEYGYGYSIIKFGEYLDGQSALSTSIGFYFEEDDEILPFGKDAVGRSDNYKVIGNIHDNPELA